eukprot:jgi/Ulvmu1/1321/UM011_0049.1
MHGTHTIAHLQIVHPLPQPNPNKPQTPSAYSRAATVVAACMPSAISHLYQVTQSLVSTSVLTFRSPPEPSDPKYPIMSGRRRAAAKASPAAVLKHVATNNKRSSQQQWTTHPKASRIEKASSPKRSPSEETARTTCILSKSALDRAHGAALCGDSRMHEAIDTCTVPQHMEHRSSSCPATLTDDAHFEWASGGIQPLPAAWASGGGGVGSSGGSRHAAPDLAPYACDPFFGLPEDLFKRAKAMSAAAVLLAAARANLRAAQAHACHLVTLRFETEDALCAARGKALGHEAHAAQLRGRACTGRTQRGSTQRAALAKAAEVAAEAARLHARAEELEGELVGRLERLCDAWERVNEASQAVRRAGAACEAAAGPVDLEAMPLSVLQRAVALGVLPTVAIE